MQENWRLHPRTITAIATVLLLLHAAPALANDEQTSVEPNRKLSADTLIRVEAPETSEESWLRNLHTKRGRGFEYSHSFRLSPERKIILSIQGPIMKKTTPGLAFEIRF